MALKIASFTLWFSYEPSTFRLVISYTPCAIGKDGRTQPLDVYAAKFAKTRDEIPESLTRKLGRLGEYVQAMLEPPEIEVEGVPIRGNPILVSYVVSVGWELVGLGGAPVTATFDMPGVRARSVDLRFAEQPDGMRRLVENILPTCGQLSWEHLRERLGPATLTTGTQKRKVFITYRRGGQDRQQFVEALAHRLGRESFVPWYDEWEIRAGDSIPRELAAGLDKVYGILVVLTSDYPGERWARAELESAITQRAEQGIRVIPVLYEACDRPELLRALRYVDCTDHREEQFERQFRDLIDALNEIELNPYR
jgi:hypothetical protein